MADSDPSDTDNQAPRFPYQVLWEELGDEWVTIEYLAGYLEEYRNFAAFSDRLGLKVPNPSLVSFETLTSRSKLSNLQASCLAKEAWLIAGWYLAPERQRAIRNDLESARSILSEIAGNTRRLYDLSNQVSGNLVALMEIVREDEPDVFDKTGPSFDDLGRSSHDFALVAERILEDLAPQQPGRHKEHIRDTTIRLAIVAAQRAGLDDLIISRGTRANPDPHLKGKAGEFLKGFFALIAPNLHINCLVFPIERVRRKMRT